jgi:hypothetical protein
MFFLTEMVMADEGLWLESEKIGEFSQGLSEKVLKKKLHCAFKLGEDTMWGADGLYHQTWSCPALGISFDMSSEGKRRNKVINQITIFAPSRLKTRLGIQIGSSEKQVIKAYNKVKDVQGTIPQETFVAGSVYGGLFFQFKNAKVESITLGSGAE